MKQTPDSLLKEYYNLPKRDRSKDGERIILAYYTLAKLKNTLNYIFIGLILFAIVSIPIAYALDTKFMLPCSWVEGRFVANDSYYQGYEKRCAEKWRNNELG